MAINQLIDILYRFFIPDFDTKFDFNLSFVLLATEVFSFFSFLFSFLIQGQ